MTVTDYCEVDVAGKLCAWEYDDVSVCGEFGCYSCLTGVMLLDCDSVKIGVCSPSDAYELSVSGVE